MLDGSRGRKKKKKKKKCFDIFDFALRDERGGIELLYTTTTTTIKAWKTRGRMTGLH